jgi:hypothetical protein
MNPAQFVIILGLRLYRNFISPFKSFVFGPAGQCRFSPSCSCYAMEAVHRHGAMTGAWLSLRRLLRCNPWGGAGHDPVPLKPQATKEGSRPGRTALPDQLCSNPTRLAGDRRDCHEHLPLSP